MQTRGPLRPLGNFDTPRYEKGFETSGSWGGLFHNSERKSESGFLWLYFYLYLDVILFILVCNKPLGMVSEKGG